MDSLRYVTVEFAQHPTLKIPMTTQQFVVHHGSCHCKAVQFDFDAPSDLVETTCNCSICTMKRNAHTIVPKSRFRLIQGEDMLTLYTFNTHQAKHLFCKRCGVQAFYIPRSNPDGYAITTACVDPSTITSVTTNSFDGQNWETSFEASNMASYSKD